ncbi:MAG: 3-hydroxy-5-phosphonooxypentane-2,4-dione thiolase [Candidatus Omnitrophica bacterium]|nr:3-hydroxy-5-phosphonooxypentane-2,4-dione thiolase [Candidatus Omnitrophota bacterium]MBU4346696.1 3-hydroxy-5-phosphonooxypentane-2,4-dione thiolase [Candidatus Omnitrophota bacterium]MBU4472766.1 3-hydroxy-5-phosphonooxypentane-2,4-dione thiolase [Candidatus Omnitrophota bacterium]MCG2706378.1 3-hydroxy-5-phosphonooxypentane-2,4-dione thiolase [Candidatus Omnitrophota bacterium]
MDWGMKNRMSRIFKPDDGHTVMLAVDHGYFLGPVSRLEKPAETIEPLIPLVDSLMLTRGLLRNCINPKYNIPVVLRVSGGNSIIGGALSNEGITVSMQDALRLNVSAVALSIYVGTDHQHQTLINLANLINAAEDYGIPVLAVTAVGKELEKRDARYLSLSCRIAAELGARIVKTYYCEDFEKVIESCPVPVVIAGGPKMKSELDVLEIAYNAMARGAKGVDMGRNIWQSEWPQAMASAISSIVHKKASVKQAVDLFNSLKNRGR